MKKKIFLGLLVILFLLCGAGYLGLFDPEWKKYSLESPYVDEQGRKAPRKSSKTKIAPLYTQLRLKGLIYQFSIEEVIGGEETTIDKLCNIDVYSLDENNLLPINNTLYYLNNGYINGSSFNNVKDNLSNVSFHFHINGKINRKDDYYKSITKDTEIKSVWLPASTIFNINAENILNKIDENGLIIDKTTAKYPNQWKQLELCLKDMERKGRELNKRRRYLTNELTLSNKNNDNSILKNKIKNAVLSDKSFIRIADNIHCNYNYDTQGWLDNSYSGDYWKDKPRQDLESALKNSSYQQYINYKQYNKAFYTSQRTFIDVYNVDEKIYIRMFAKYMNGLPYIAKYCEE